MLFFPKIKPKEHLFVKCSRLLIIVILQTASFHVILHFLRSKFHRQLQAFHGLSLSFAVVYSLEVIYHKIYSGCMNCFLSASVEHKNDHIDEKLIVAAVSFQMFLIPHHYRRRHTRLKGLLTLLFDSFSVIEMTKSLLKGKGASTLAFMVFFYSLADPILSLICIMRSTAADTNARGRNLLLETVYIILFMLTNIFGLVIWLFLGIGGKYSPPPLMTLAFIFKTVSASITTQFLSMILQRRYAAAMSSFFKQLFFRTVLTEIDYYENSFVSI